MAIDYKEDNEEVKDELEYAALDFDDENVEIVSDSVFVDTNDYIVSEIRKNLKFNQLFEMAMEEKEAILEEKKAKFGMENSEASECIIKTTEGLNKAEIELENEIGKEVESVDYFTYRIGDLEFSKEDLSIVNASKEEYDNCLEDAIKMRRDLKNIDKELKKIKLANSLFFRRRYTYRSDEYQLSCFKVNKAEKLNEDEEFLRKFDFLKSLSSVGRQKLRDLLIKSEMVGTAVETLENNGKESKDLKTREGQVEVLKEALGRTVSDEDYAELIEFINATRERVKSKEFDDAGIEVDDSESGKLIKAFVDDLEKSRKNSKAIDEMIKEFSGIEAQSEEVESTVKSTVEETKVEENNVEEIDETEMFDEIAQAETEEQKDSDIDIQNNMIVTLVLESGKFKTIVEEIRKREKDIYAEKRAEIIHSIDKKMKSSRLAAKYVERDKVELAGLLEAPIKVEEDGCLIKDLFIRPEDVYLANINEEEYTKLLEDLDEIKKDRKAVEKDIRVNRRAARRSPDGGYLADIDLSRMNEEKEAIIAAQENAEARIAFAEFFANLNEEQLHRTVLFISAIGERNNSQAQADELKEQLKALEEEQDEYRKPVMEQALVELAKEGAISKNQHQELVNYIRGYQKGFEDGTYRVIDDYERDESTLAQVVYDYIDLINKNREKMKTQEQKSKSKKEQDDDGDIDI